MKRPHFYTVSRESGEVRVRVHYHNRPPVELTPERSLKVCNHSPGNSQSINRWLETHK